MQTNNLFLFQRIILELKNVQTDVSEIGDHMQRMEDQMTSVLHMMEHMCRLMIGKDKEKHRTRNDKATKLENKKGNAHAACIVYNMQFYIHLFTLVCDYT